MLCYEDRSSFLRLKHVLCRHRMDRHMQLSSASMSSVAQLAGVLCATKEDRGAKAVSQAGGGESGYKDTYVRTYRIHTYMIIYIYIT